MTAKKNLKKYIKKNRKRLERLGRLDAYKIYKINLAVGFRCTSEECVEIYKELFK